MAEALAGLGVAASVIAVIQITEDVIKLCAEYASSIKDARSDMQNICAECESVQSVLKRLHGMCTDTKSHQQMPSLQLLIRKDGPLSQYQDQLKNLVAELRLPKGWKETVEILKWPMKAKRIEKALQIMERKKVLLTLALTMDSASLITILAAELSDAAKSLGVISDNINAISEKVTTMANATDVIVHDGLYKVIIHWLSAPDPSSNHNDACRKRHPETGKWFLDGDALQCWKNQPASFLWLHGIRTRACICHGYIVDVNDSWRREINSLVSSFHSRGIPLVTFIISSSIIQHISKCHAGMPSVAVAYFYFDFNDAVKQKHGNFLRSLIVQLLTSLTVVPESISIFYKKHRDGRQPSTNQLLEMLRSLVELYQDCYLFWDALDECADLTELLGIIKEIVDWKLANLHILTTCRKERQISDSLDLLVTEQTSIQGSPVDRDISIYVRERLQTDSGLIKWPVSVQDEISQVLARDAQGMFRWAACQLDTLRTCHKLDTLRAALRSLPKDLDETYHRILSKIIPEYEADVKKVLQWLACSARPVRLAEVAEALAIEYSDTPRFNPEQRLPEPLDILTMCSSLVTISDYNELMYSHLFHQPHEGDNRNANMPGELKLAHNSVKEYLISQHIRGSRIHVTNYSFSECSAHRVIAETCLIYLLHFKEAYLTPNTLASFPLAGYAALNWSFHAHFGNDIFLPDLQPLLLHLFRPDCNQFSNWIEIHNMTRKRSTSRFRNPITLDKSAMSGPLYFSCMLGLLAVAKNLADSGVNVNEKGGLYGNPLQAATYEDNEAIVRMLLEKGADVNAQGGLYGTALQAAVSKDNVAMVRTLLEKGADVNAQGGEYGNALQAAACVGNEEMVQVLLEKGADVNAQGGEHGNALYAAARVGNEATARVLLEKGADVNAQGGEYGNALQAAACVGNEAMVRLLLEKGADVNAQGGEYGNALQAAACVGNEAMVRVLLEKGADVNAKSGFYGNALQAAACEGNEKTVRVLLEKGADVNARNGEYGNALYAAAEKGNAAMVRVLLEKGADVNAQGGRYRNALQAAACKDHEAMVRVLLDKGADVNVKGGVYGNALQAAACTDNEAMVRVLLDKGADVNAQGGKYGNALQAAARKYNETIVRVLLEKGADVNAQGGKYGNALQAAACESNEATVRVLLEKGVDLNAKGGVYGNALQAAAITYNEAIARVLLEKGADVNAQGGVYGNALQAAACTDNEAMVRVLLEKGADVNAQGGKYGSALQAAASESNKAIVRVLLEKGADVNVQGGEFGNALQAAVCVGSEAIVRVLLEKGADVNVEGGEYGNVLQAAHLQNNKAILQVLLESGADETNTVDTNGTFSLHPSTQSSYD